MSGSGNCRLLTTAEKKDSEDTKKNDKAVSSGRGGQCPDLKGFAASIPGVWSAVQSDLFKLLVRLSVPWLRTYPHYRTPLRNRTPSCIRKIKER